MSTATKLNRVLQTKDSLKTALQNKGQDVTNNTPFKNYASYIGNLDNTSDATATGHDLLQGKFAYSKGVKIGGGITYIGEGMSAKVDAQSEYVSNYVSKQCVKKEEQPKHIIAFEQGATVITDISYSDIVRVTGMTADKIKKDTTILGVTGTYDGGVAAALSASY